jgi:hypothetical protein
MSVSSIRGRFIDINLFECDISKEILPCERGLLPLLKHIFLWNNVRLKTIYEVPDKNGSTAAVEETIFISLETVRAKIRSEEQVSKKVAEGALRIGHAFSQVMHKHIDDRAQEEKRIQEENKKRLDCSPEEKIPQEYMTGPVVIVSGQIAQETKQAVPKEEVVVQEVFSKKSSGILSKAIQENPEKERMILPVFVFSNVQAGSESVDLLAYKQALRTDPTEQIPVEFENDISFIRAQRAAKQRQRQLRSFINDLTYDLTIEIPLEYQMDLEFLSQQQKIRARLHNLENFQKAVNQNKNAPIPAGNEHDDGFIQIQNNAYFAATMKSLCEYKTELLKNPQLLIPKEYEQEEGFVIAREEALGKAKLEAFLDYKLTLFNDPKSPLPKLYELDEEFIRAKSEAPDIFRTNNLVQYKIALLNNPWLSIPKEFEQEEGFIIVRDEALVKAKLEAFVTYKQALFTDPKAPLPVEYDTDGFFIQARFEALQRSYTQTNMKDWT